MQIPFENAAPGTFVLALELQIVDQASYGLAARGADIVADLDVSQHASRHIRSGARQDFLELLSGEHEHPAGMLAQMQEIKSAALAAAHINHAFLMGGASHPFASRDASVMTDVDSFFGTRVQVGVRGADQAIRLAQGLSMYVPHMIALSASSPLLNGEDTGVASMRLQAAVPRLTSMPRSIECWADYEGYVARRHLVGRTDRLNWDIVPRPELGRIEVQVMDAPLTVERASELAGWIQVLSEWIMRQDSWACPSPVDQAVNRYQATLFGLQATYVGSDGRRMFLQQALLDLMDDLSPVADELGSLAELQALVRQIECSGMEAQWLRHHWAASGSSDQMVRSMVQRFDAAQHSEHEAGVLASFRA